jgi:saccharopine dehydrogenase-like NADP-dependent oxidoreductase
MSKILILGGTGQTGRLLSRHLLKYSEATVTIGTRYPDKAKVLIDELNQNCTGIRASAIYANASDAESLLKAFRGHSLVVVAAPTTAYTKIVVQATLQAGIDYLDVQLDPKKFAYLQSIKEEIECAGKTFITEAGFHPGLPSALVRYVAAHMDSIESAITAGYLNMGKDLPYTEAVDELIELFKEYQSQVYKNGKWTKTSSYDIRKIDFGGDIGLKQCYSMFFEELRTLPDMYPSLKEVGFYISESHWVTDWVIMPIVWMWLKIRPKAVRSIGKLLWWGMGTFHKPPYRVELQVRASGSKDGQMIKSHVSVSHPDGYELTAIPVVAALLQYLDGTARKPGLWMMGHLVEPNRLFKDMEKMGVKCITNFQ